MLIYIRNKSNRKSGGNHSQEILSKLIENNGGLVFCLKGNSWSRFLNKLFKFSLTYKESKNIYSINLLETKPYKFMGFYMGGYFVKRFINKFIFSITIRNLISNVKENKYKAILEVFEIDYFEILKKRFENIKIASLLRSSPHCLIWSNSFLLKDNIIKCINSSEFIISASRDVSDMWIDMSKNHLIKFFRINVPIEEKKLIKFNFDEDNIYSFICITGAVGPRKGIHMMINSIGTLLKKINKKGKVIILGVCDKNTKELIHKQISLFEGFLQVEMMGYRLSSVHLSCNRRKSYFIFCSFMKDYG